MTSNEKLITNIVDKINFKINPDQNIRKQYFYRIKKKFYKLFNQEKQFVHSITRFNNIEEKDKEFINKISDIDCMMPQIAIGFIINQICKTLTKDQIYLNIGVWRGFSLFSGMINTSCTVYGVDNFSHNYKTGDENLDNFKENKATYDYFFDKLKIFQNITRHFFFDLDYIKFFNEFEKKKLYLDFYYYDGEHSYKNQYDNLVIADNFLKKNSIILVDDFNEPDVANATLDFIASNNKKYKVIKSFKTANRFIHPTYTNGIILFEKIGNY